MAGVLGSTIGLTVRGLVSISAGLIATGGFASPIDRGGPGAAKTEEPAKPAGDGGAGVAAVGLIRLASTALSVCIAFLMSSIIVSTGPESNNKSTGISQKSSIKSSRPM